MSETANEHMQEQGVENLTPEAYETISGLVRANDAAGLLRNLRAATKPTLLKSLPFLPLICARHF